MLKDDLVVSLPKRGTCSADKGLSSKQKVILRDAAVIWTEITNKRYMNCIQMEKFLRNLINLCSE